MRTIRCVEPALAVGTLQYVVEAAVDDEILFPHVDSCLAIGLILSDGRAVGGHVAVQKPGSDKNPIDPTGNAMDIVGEMLPLRRGATVTKVILVGDASWQDDFMSGNDVIQSVIDEVGCADTLFVIKPEDLGGGVNASLNPRRKMVFIQRCVAPPTLVYQLPYSEIAGNQTATMKSK